MDGGGNTAPRSAPDANSRSRRLLRSLTLPLHDLLTTVFPADCQLCGEPLLRSGRLPVCESCLRAPRPLIGSRCHICGDPLGFENERTVGLLPAQDRRCTPCRLAPPDWERAVAAAVYDAALRDLLHLFKYSGVRQLARPLGEQLARSIASFASELAPPEPASTSPVDSAGTPAAPEILLVPVPLFRDRRRERGFNQAEALAEAARGYLRHLLPNLRFRLAAHALDRTRATESQFALNPRQRRHNVRGAFAASASVDLHERDIILIDDIFTTGATARACATALRRAGARRVWIATVARAEPETVALWDGGSPNA